RPPAERTSLSSRTPSRLRRKRPQVDALVGELCGFWPGLRANEAGTRRHLRVFVQLGVPTAVETDRRQQHPRLQIEAEQLPVLEAPANHEPIPVGGVADVLELVLVLVGPEGVDVVVRSGRAEHRPSSGAPPLLAVVVVLDTN